MVVSQEASVFTVCHGQVLQALLGACGFAPAEDAWLGSFAGSRVRRAGADRGRRHGIGFASDMSAGEQSSAASNRPNLPLVQDTHEITLIRPS